MNGPNDRKPPAPGRDALDALLSECRVDTFRSGGKGGQHQNKVESGVRLTHLPTGTVVTSRRRRSQLRNRDEALRRLRALLDERERPRKPRVATSVPKAERRRRLDAKKRRSRVKRLRRAPDDPES